MLAETRERFLTHEQVEPSHVRAPILASWQRSRELNVAADRIEVQYSGDPDLHTPLTRSADPVLRSLRDQLDGQPVSIILTDPTGVVLIRMTGDADLERHLDRVLLAPGFSYSEEFVGTNGIGTALEGGGPAQVFGHEHYAEHLEHLACAGVPIHHPISGKTVGAIDLTCWRRDAGSLLLTLAKTTAEQIRQALLAEAGMRELELLGEYLRTCRRMTGAVLALSDDVVMLNEHARSVLDPADQSALIDLAAGALAGGRRGSIDVQLPTGVSARLFCRPVGSGDRPSGGVVHVRLNEAPAIRTPPAGGYVSLPGLVGSAPLWQRACQEIEQVYRSGDWLAVEGEPGVGKVALLRAVQLRRQPVGRLVVLDAAEETDRSWPEKVRRALLGDADSLVVRHVDRFSKADLRRLSTALQSVPATVEHRTWVAVTLSNRPKSADLERLLRRFPSTVQVPPLRLHLEDLQPLVQFLLSRMGLDGRLACASETTQLLLRSSWPGNIEQVHQLLRYVVRSRRTGLIRPADLPPEARTVSRRLLSQLESMERDAIVQNLIDSHGNKAEAARSLGMSRATIYRKIHEYGILAPAP
jgi:transcriptional regulator of acetoin/glycerol metabolism